jgi:hypothetical protein
MGPWTGGPEGAIDRLRLPFRVMLSLQGFTVVYAPVAQLELEMTPGASHATQPANAECPQCHGDGHVQQHGGQEDLPKCNGCGWVRATPGR